MYLKVKEFNALLDQYQGLDDVISQGAFKVTHLADALDLSVEEARKIINVLTYKLQALKNTPQGYKLDGEASIYFKNMRQKNAVNTQKDLWIKMFNMIAETPDVSMNKQIKYLCDNYGMDKLIRFFVEHPKFKANRLRVYLGVDGKLPYGIFNVDVLVPLTIMNILVPLSIDVEMTTDDANKSSDNNEMMNLEYCVNPELFDQDNTMFGTLELDEDWSKK